MGFTHPNKVIFRNPTLDFRHNLLGCGSLSHRRTTIFYQIQTFQSECWGIVSLIHKDNLSSILDKAC